MEELDKSKQSGVDEGEVRLQKGHLWIDARIANALFKEASQAFLVYYPSTNTLMLASQHDELFPKLHKSSLQLLKVRTAAGDRSVSLQELIIDHEIADEDRVLNSKVDVSMGVLQIFI